VKIIQSAINTGRKAAPFYMALVVPKPTQGKKLTKVLFLLFKVCTFSPQEPLQFFENLETI